MLLIIARKEVVKDGENPRPNLAQVLCIRYPINFREKSVSTLFNSDSKVSAVYLTFAKALGLFIRPTDFGAQKIDSIILDTYEMVVTAFLLLDEANRVRFFENTFLVANISPDIVFEMFFLTLNRTDIDFLNWKLR